MKGLIRALTVSAVVALAGSAFADDLVLLKNGGRVRGAVIEADPEKGVLVRLADGTTRQFSPGEIADIRYEVVNGQLPPDAGPPSQSPPLLGRPVEPSSASVPPPPISPVPYGGSNASVPAPQTAASGPPARLGFQMSLRLGLAFPGGDVDSGEALSDFFGEQFGGILEIGGKLNEKVFLGVYFGGSGGGVGGQVRTLCDDSGLSCRSITGRLGVELLYSLQPGEKFNPWFGYGGGFSAATIQLAGPSGRVDLDLYGIEWAHLLFGADLRLSDSLGLGAFVDLTLGTFTSMHSSADGSTKAIPDQNETTHVWLNLGVRGVLFP